MICTRCHRPLKHASDTGMGPVCSKRAKASAPIAHERDLFGYDVDKAFAAARHRLDVALRVSAAVAWGGIRRDYEARARQRYERWLAWRDEVMARRAARGTQ